MEARGRKSSTTYVITTNTSNIYMRYSSLNPRKIRVKKMIPF